jgi:hypothetical protein
LARAAQGTWGWGRQVFTWVSGRVLLVGFSCALLSACGSKGFSIENAVPDRSITTGSISSQPPPPPADTVRVSDEATIRDAVSSAPVDEVGENGIGWANAGTGSRGSITNVRESRDTGYLCRQFTASRESYNGVFMYRGETCLGAERIWVMRAFDRVE